MARLRAKPHLGRLQPVAHGGPDEAELCELGVPPDELLDFSVNTNPAPIPDELRRVIASADVSTYPDSDCRRLREAAAEAYGVRPEQVLAGNGSAELIWLIALAFVEAGDSVLLPQPTFGEYERAALIHAATILRVPACPSLDIDVFESILERAPRVAFVCNPNNPTGRQMAPALLTEVARRHPETLLVVDEAYADFVAGRPTTISSAMPENLVVLRSLTKFSALAGLRLGVAFGQPEAICWLGKVKPPWNVNAAAQAAGEYALRHPELLPDLDWLAEAREEMLQGLRGLGLKPLPTDCNFFLLPLAGGARVRRLLLEQRCLVRDCTSFGLPDHVRIAVRSGEDNRRLLAAFEAVL